MDDMDKISMGGIDDDPLKNSIEYNRIETDSDNDKYELILRGYRKIPGAKVWEKLKGAPNRFNMTEEAVNYIVSVRNAVMTKGTMQGNLSGEVKLKMYDESVKAYMDAIDLMFMVHGDEWNISVSEANAISTEIEEHYRLLLTRTLDNKERDRDKANESFSHHDDMNSDDKGFK